MDFSLSLIPAPAFVGYTDLPSSCTVLPISARQLSLRVAEVSVQRLCALTYSGAALFGVLGEGLTVSEDEEESPPLPGDGGMRQSSVPVVPAPLPPQAGGEPGGFSSFHKRTMDNVTTTGEDLIPTS